MANQIGNLFIQNGMIVDGTGATAFKANLRIRDGMISEISDTISAASDERVFDAEGCFVTPGLIESHTHFDGTMWWQPDLIRYQDAA